MLPKQGTLPLAAQGAAFLCSTGCAPFSNIGFMAVSLWFTSPADVVRIMDSLRKRSDPQVLASSAYRLRWAARCGRFFAMPGSRAVRKTGSSTSAGCSSAPAGIGWWWPPAGMIRPRPATKSASKGWRSGWSARLRS